MPIVCFISIDLAVIYKQGLHKRKDGQKSSLLISVLVYLVCGVGSKIGFGLSNFLVFTILLLARSCATHTVLHVYYSVMYYTHTNTYSLIIIVVLICSKYFANKK